jgi:hypothetical protein
MRTRFFDREVVFDEVGLFIDILLLHDLIEVYFLRADAGRFDEDRAAEGGNRIFLADRAAMADIDGFIDGRIGARVGANGGWSLAGRTSAGRVGIVQYINGKELSYCVAESANV